VDASPIPVCSPTITEREVQSVLSAVRSGWVSSKGPALDEFERGWAEYCGRGYGVAVSNGTTALGLAVRALDLRPGDEVLVPTFTIISCALAVIEAGATPVWVDADPTTWTMDVGDAARRWTERTRAIMPVHIYGHPVDMDPLLALAERSGAAVIEDAAEAHGAEYLTGRSTSAPAWRRCGSFGEMSCFSFYANKIVTTGEGGMILTDDDALADRLRRLRDLGFTSERRFCHEELGTNARLTNLQAALGVAQIARIDETIARKRAVADEYRRRLGGVAGLQLPPREPWARSVYWMFGVVIDEQTGVDAEQVAARLAARGIETRPFFLGMNEQPVLRRLGLCDGSCYPVAARLARQGLYLPSGPDLTPERIDRVCGALREGLR
jgi:perosamine synthetase